MSAAHVSGVTRGHERVSLEELRAIEPLEVETSTYSPLSHYDFAMNTASLGADMLKSDQFKLNGADYVVSKDGGKMFMVQTFDHTDRNDIRLAVAGRNSTDKTMAAAVAMGAQVFCCANTIVNGTIKVFRKHTGDMYQYLQDQLIIAFHKATDGWSNLQDDVAEMKKIDLTDDEAFRQMGHMWGKKIIKPIEMRKVRDRWFKPEQEEFQPRNYWSLYNAVRDVYTDLAPAFIMNKPMDLHRYSRDHVLETEDHNYQGGALLGDLTSFRREVGVEAPERERI